MFKVRSKIIIFLLLLLAFYLHNLRSVFAQVPVINALSIHHGTVDEKVTISGNNFPTDPANTKVIFGSVTGIVNSTSSNSIVVSVPSGTTTDNITVINTFTGLSASSRRQFFLSYSGDNFDPGQLDSEVDYLSTVEVLDLCLCDFDNDGKSDVAATKVNTQTDILVYKNNSVIESINLSEQNGATDPELDLNSPTSNITCGDLDGDGLQDLIVSKTGNPRNVIYILKNISSGGTIRFAPAVSLFLTVEEIAKRLEVKDVDLDGKPEIIVSNTFNDNLKVFQNTSTPGNIQLNPTPLSISMTGAGTVNGLVVEDMNGDRLPDLVTNPFFGSNIYIRLNNSTPGNFQFGSVQVINVSGNLNILTPGDFNNDGLMDLAVTKTVQNEIAILRNLTPANNISVSFDQQNLATSGNPWGIYASDMDGDGQADLLVANRDDTNINVFENTGTGTGISFNRHIVPTNLFTRNIAGGDMDGDAIPDIVFTSFNSTPRYALGVIRNANCFKPLINPLGPLSLCVGGTIDLAATKGIGVTYTWDRDNVVFKTGPEDTIIVTQAGVYKVIAESASGVCTEISNAVIINSGTGGAPTDPIIYNNGPFCQGGDIVLTTDPIAGAIYSWQGPDNFASNSQNITISNASPSRAGTYSLQVRVGDCSSNVAATTVDLISLPSFTITAGGPTKICEGNSVQLSVNLVNGYTYQWYLEGQSIVGGVGNTYDATEDGTYHVEITQTSSSCITSSTNTIDIRVIARPEANFYYTDPGCANNQIQFINSSTFEAGESVAYFWDFGDGSFPVNNENPTHTYTMDDTYTINFIIAYTEGTCRDTVQSPIMINPAPVFEILAVPNATVCTGDPVTLSISGSFASYLWNTGQSTNQITVYRPGEYTASVTDVNRCVAQEILMLDMWPKPQVSATANPDETIEDSEVQLSAVGALTYEWRPGEILDDPLSPSPVARLSETTEFFVVGTNAEGCSDTASVVVRVQETNTINVNPRKVFSPNGDGIDDFWSIEYIENYPGASVTIYNGNGSIVYESNNYNGEWDAVYEGKDLPETAYFYVIRYQNKNPKTGSVTVIR